NDPSLVHQVGCFINLLVVRADLSGDPCFSELVGRVRDTSLTAYSHQEVPYDHVVDRVCKRRDLSRNPLGQVLFQFSDAELEASTFPNLKVTLQQSLGLNARFDLELNLVSDQDSIAGELVFNTDIFQPATIIRFVEHFQNLLESLVENTSQPISKLQMLSAIELHEVLKKWNQTSVTYPEGNGVHQLFEEQVGRTPDVVAIEFGGLTLSYRELDDRANHLANDLRGHGLKTGETVGVCMDRSPESVVSILGILKAGAAYVPLDPDYPRKRLECMIQDAEI
ncbi:MAG: AMP-binding protein, partial [Planctomycetaceae bacterium]|nr:AMP-binding protein [Planctomycetaceae bacterium]